MALSDTDRTFKEGATGNYSAILKDHLGAAIPLASIASASLALFHDDDDGANEAKTVVNNRDAQNVLNANNVTIHDTTGAITWEIQAGDTAIVASPAPNVGETEKHVAQFRVVYDTTRVLIHEVVLLVRNLARRP